MAQHNGKARDGGVRSLERGLALLTAMNRRRLPSVVELARDTHLPRPTVYRLLETLSRAGFVTRSSPHDRYCLTSQVRALSDGFAEDDWIADIAAPLMTQLTRQLVWPVALMTFEARPHAGARDHPRSQHAVNRSRHGRTVAADAAHCRRPLLSRALLRQRRGVRSSTCSRARSEPRTGVRARPQRLTKLLDAIRAKGYAIQDREINPKTTGIAVPIHLGARVARKLVADLDFVRNDDRTGGKRVLAAADLDRKTALRRRFAIVH